MSVSVDANVSVSVDVNVSVSVDANVSVSVSVRKGRKYLATVWGGNIW